jgi:general secretion pathway protein G
MAMVSPLSLQLKSKPLHFMKTKSLMTRTLARSRTTAFTLMELMLVLGIIGILVAAGVKMGPVVKKFANNGSAKGQVTTLSGIITMYQSSHNGRLPSSMKDLVSKGMIGESEATDPWGNMYQLVVPARRSKEKYDLFSQGEKTEDDADDVGNWDNE